MDWKISEDFDSFGVALKRYKRFLENKGCRQTTIENYSGCVRRYITFCQTPVPTNKDLERSRDHLFDEHLGRSTINNYSFAVEHYCEMLGEKVKLQHLKRNEIMPYYFDESEVQAIFSACQNLKHLAMLQLLFFGCLRASELCNLDDLDLDLKGLSVRVREGKGGRDGITYISEECAGTLRRYLEIRPQLLIEGRQPLFYTDFGNRWCRNDLHRMFIRIKRQAGITKRGGVHCFSRHTPATIMVSRGCDLRIIKEVLRHKDIRTTLKYVHVNDKVAHEWYNKTLRLDAKSLAWN